MAAWFRSRCLLELTRGKLSKSRYPEEVAVEEGEEEGSHGLLHLLLLHLIATT
jgi:hypothetical protein